MKKKYLGLKQQFLLLSLCSGSLMASPCQAVQPCIPGFVGNTADFLPATTLPTGGSIIQGIDSIREITDASRMEITQNAPKAVIHWQNFNIGSSASVNFSQKNEQGEAQSSWSALNVVKGNDYSQILGKLSADGHVYLINQNGILFGPNAQVNVHSLTASSLNLNETDFSNGYTDATAKTLTFKNDLGVAGTPVENSGTITAADGGQVFLIGGKAVNSGTITANQGFVALAAGEEVKLQYVGDIKRYGFPGVTTTVDTTTGCKAEATNTGLLQADEGIVGLYGGIVNQNGRAIATTAIARNGQIELTGLSQVSTGAGSVTATPVTASTERQTPPENEADIKRGLITVNTKEFIHQGAISSPGGEVNIGKTNTMDSILLKSGSSIDVSGMWVDQSAEDRFLKVQLNSDTLKNAYALKSGPLFGKTVRIDILNGMPAADISNYLDNRTRSASEQLTEGGIINLKADRVEIAAGSNIDISGGGYNYAAGEIEQTMVRVGNKIYSLSNLPAGVPVDAVMGTFTREHTRYGIKETWNGFYTGSSNPLTINSPAFLQGSDAGELIIRTPYLFMAGALDGWAERGLYQTEEEDKTYANGKTMAIGRRMPKGGALTVGGESTTDPNTSNKTDYVYNTANDNATTRAIAVVAAMDNTPAESGLTTAVSTISSSIINNAGLSSLDLHANTTLSLAEDASIQLTPGGSFNASARKIDISGDILAPGGSITIAAKSNKTSYSTNITDKLEESLSIHSGAVLDVSGEEISNLGRQVMTYGYTKGGNITLSNQSAPSDGPYGKNYQGYNLTVAAGSRLSVQGGYWQDTNGKTTGADAGSLKISQDIYSGTETEKLKDLHLTIDGELLGHALLGNKGGSLTIGANEMTIFPAAGSPPPASPSTDLWNSIVLADNRFAGTGFSSITLNTFGNLTVTGGSHLQPSLISRTAPISYYGGGQPAGLVSTSSGFITALPLEAGATKIALNAGKDSKNKLTLEEGSIISVTPNGKGKIILSTSGLADIGGTLEAPAGSITITGKDVTVEESARILAQGVNLEQQKKVGPKAEASWKVLDGGTVSLAATNGTGGDLIIESGSLIDVSGSPLVTNPIKDSLGGFFHRDEAGSPGSITLKFNDELTLAGTLTAESYLSDLSGGKLTIERTHLTEALAMTRALIQASHQPGFDDFHYASYAAIDFVESAALTSSRRLVLDAPQLIGSGGTITLEAPWVQIVNKYIDNEVTPISAIEDAARSLTVQADFIDITGEIRTDGFSTVNLLADRAIRLSDQYYAIPLKWSGKLAVSADLTLQANAIYPTTNSAFTINSPGLVSILPGQNTTAATVYSAGGSLTINAHDIYHAGALYAPMGEISLTADKDEGKVMLAPGSLVSVSGSQNVSYGIINDAISNDNYGTWQILDKSAANDSTYKAMTVPEPSITIAGKEVLVTEGSRIEADGGGSLSADLFLPGLDGTANPLDTKNRFVIIPDNSISLPELNGKELSEIYLEGYAPLGLAEGTYCVLPAEFAFLPGALILEPGATGFFPGQGAVNLLSQPVIAGYEKAYGSNETPTTMTEYVLRTVSDVLKEGEIDHRTEQVNNGSIIDINGGTLVMLGAVSALGAENGLNGELKLAGTNINYGAVPAELRGLTSMVDMDRLKGYANSAWLDTSMFSGDGALSKLTLGNAATEAVTFAAGQTLKGIPHVVVNAGGSITISENAAIEALATTTQKGVLELHTDTLTTEAGSLLHASNELLLDIDSDWDFGGGWQVDDGLVHLASQDFSIGSDSNKDFGTGLFMTKEMFNDFATVKELWIESETDIRFMDGITLTTSGSLLLDSQRLLFDNPASDKQEVSITAGTLRLSNSHEESAETVPADTKGHSLKLAADNLTLGPGTVRVDGFTNVNLESSSSLFFEGQGDFQAKLPDAGVLTMKANGFFAAYPEDVETLSANRFTVDSGKGEVLMQNNGAAASTFAGTPGNLGITGRSITMDAALLNFPGGRIELKATGEGEEDKILLKNGTQLLARGGILKNNLGLSDSTLAVQFNLSGGEVLLSAASGKVDFEGNGSTTNIIDVSATDNQNAGRVSINGGKSDLDPTRLTLLGGGGTGGSLDLVTRALPQLGDLATALSDGGFTNELRIQAREEDMSLGAGQTLAARSISLAADGVDDPVNSGKITIAGTVNASGSTGGKVSIYAGNDLNVANAGLIEAKGTDGDGGEVVLGSERGFVRTDAQATIDTRGADPADTQDGTVTFRTDVTGDTTAGYGVKLDDQGTTHGAKRLQAVKSYPYPDLPLDINAWKTDTTKMVIDLTNAGYTIDPTTKAGYTLVPEIEVNATGDLTLPSSITLTGLETWRPGGLPGVLTFRAAGHLNVETSITDVPSQPINSGSSGFRDPFDNQLGSWGLNFVAGADLSASNPLSTNAAKDLNIGSDSGNVIVYSESGDINLAAGHNITIMAFSNSNALFYDFGSYMPGVKSYTVGTFDGDIHARAGMDLDLSNTYPNTTYGGVLQNGIGDIDIETGGDILLGDYGAIRTTGRMPTEAETGKDYIELKPDKQEYKKEKDYQKAYKLWTYSRSKRYWEFRDGGDITIHTGGKVQGTVLTGTNLDAAPGWENAYSPGSQSWLWSANYDTTGYKNNSAKNIKYSPTHGIATMGGGSISVETGNDFLAQAGAFGQNNEAALKILTKGDLDGRFLAMKGDSMLSTLGSFGTSGKNSASDIATGIGMGDVSLTVQAMGSVDVGTIYNPTLANSFNYAALQNIRSWISYSKNNKVSLAALNGDVLLTGGTNYGNNNTERDNILPGTLDITAGRDIIFSEKFTMAPAPQGSLVLLAGQDINGRYTDSDGVIHTSALIMSDAEKDAAGVDLYSVQDKNVSNIISALNNHANTPVHKDDGTPVHIEAGNDISKFDFTLAKKAEIIAGRDLLNICYLGQHMDKDDVSILVAGRDFLQPEVNHKPKLTPDATVPVQGITQAGPGALFVIAGNNIDLDDSNGIQSIGNTENQALMDSTIDPSASGRIKGSDLTVIAGYKMKPTPDQLKEFISSVKGVSYLYTVAKGLSDSADKSTAEVLRDFLAGEKTYEEVEGQLFTAKGENGEETKPNKDLADFLAQLFGSSLSERFNSWRDKPENNFDNIKNPAALVMKWLKEDARAELFTPFLYNQRSGTGNLNMVTSGIMTIAGEDAINILAAGDVNIGFTIIDNIGQKDYTDTGIFTAGGGAINLFAENNINVNESRVMTLLGGNLLLLSDRGNINAGRGSKAKVTTAAPRLVPVTSDITDPNDPTKTITIITGQRVQFSPPAVGSGLRTLAYDPDGNGPKLTPEPGDMYVNAWDGVVDAGEAGIEGGKLFLAANQVLNAQNISVGTGSVGVPASSGAVAGLGALTGDSMSATESTTSDIAKSTASAGDKMADTAKKIADTISQLRYFVVKFLGFME